MSPETPYRIQETERRLNKLEERTEDIAVMRSELRGLAKMVEHLSDKADANQRALLATALSVTGSAIIIALSIFLVLK